MECMREHDAAHKDGEPLKMLQKCNSKITIFTLSLSSLLAPQPIHGRSNSIFHRLRAYEIPLFATCVSFWLLNSINKHSLHLSPSLIHMHSIS